MVAAVAEATDEVDGEERGEEEEAEREQGEEQRLEHREAAGAGCARGRGDEVGDVGRERRGAAVAGGGGLGLGGGRRRRGDGVVEAEVEGGSYWAAELAVGGRRERRPMGPRVRRGEWIRRRREKKERKRK